MLFGQQTRRANSFTVFTLTTRRTHELPVIDFQPRDYGAPNQQFGFEAGPVCFSWWAPPSPPSKPPPRLISRMWSAWLAGQRVVMSRSRMNRKHDDVTCRPIDWRGDVMCRPTRWTAQWRHFPTVPPDATVTPNVHSTGRRDDVTFPSTGWRVDVTFHLAERRDDVTLLSAGRHDDITLH